VVVDATHGDRARPEEPLVPEHEPEAAQPSRPPRRVLIFVTVALALLMSSLDGTIVATALHSLQHGLHASIAWTGWTITVYSLGLVLMLPLSGKLSDRYGRRRVFLASVTVFALASLCCGLAGNIYVLIALRAVQAMGGAGFTPSATGIVVEHFGSARDKAVGLFGSIFPIGSMVGPILGGVFVTYWSWRGIFLVNVPISALLIALCLRFVPADRARPVERQRGLDIVGMVLLGIGILAAMIGVTYLGGDAASPWSARFVAPIVIAVLAFAGFVRHIRRAAAPFIEPRLISGRGFAAVNVINTVYGGCVGGLTALIPLYAINRYGMSALASGTVLAAQGVAVIVMSSAAAFVLRRTGYRRPMYVGFAIVGVGVLVLAVSPVGLSPYAWLACAGCLIGIGAGSSSPASRNACLQLAPDRSASLAALRSTGRQVGSISSVSIATAVIAQTSDPGIAQAYVFAVAGVLFLLALPIVARVPEHYGSW